MESKKQSLNSFPSFELVLKNGLGLFWPPLLQQANPCVREFPLLQNVALSAL